MSMMYRMPASCSATSEEQCMSTQQSQVVDATPGTDTASDHLTEDHLKYQRNMMGGWRNDETTKVESNQDRYEEVWNLTQDSSFGASGFTESPNLDGFQEMWSAAEEQMQAINGDDNLEPLSLNGGQPHQVLENEQENAPTQARNFQQPQQQRFQEVAPNGLEPQQELQHHLRMLYLYNQRSQTLLRRRYLLEEIRLERQQLLLQLQKERTQRLAKMVSEGELTNLRLQRLIKAKPYAATGNLQYEHPGT